MYKSLAVAVLLGLGLALGGCASTSTGNGMAKDDECSRVDCAEVAAVNAIARRTGTDVIWVSLPQKN